MTHLAKPVKTWWVDVVRVSCVRHSGIRGWVSNLAVYKEDLKNIIQRQAVHLHPQAPPDARTHSLTRSLACANSPFSFTKLPRNELPNCLFQVGDKPSHPFPPHCKSFSAPCTLLFPWTVQHTGKAKNCSHGTLDFEVY